MIVRLSVLFGSGTWTTTWRKLASSKIVVLGSFFPVNQVVHSGAASLGLSSQGSSCDHRRTTSYEAYTGTMTATPTSDRMIPKPTSPDLMRSDSRNAALRPIGAGAATPSPPERSDARIEEPVHQVEDEHRDDEEVRVQGHNPDDHRGVEDRRGFEGEQTDALVIEHGFRDDRSLPCDDQGKRQARDDGRGRGPEHVLVEDCLLPQALRARRGNEILVHGLQHEVPRGVRPLPERREREREHREEHVPEDVSVPRCAAARGRRDPDPTPRREPVELEAEQEDEEDAVHPRGDDVRRDREDRHPAVEDREGLPSHPETQPDSQERPDRIREGEQRERAR